MSLRWIELQGSFISTLIASPFPVYVSISILRDWYANLLAGPDFLFHLKQGVKADLAARATPILGEAERRELLRLIAQAWGRERSLEQFVADSPLVEVTFPGADS